MYPRRDIFDLYTGWAEDLNEELIIDWYLMFFVTLYY